MNVHSEETVALENWRQVHEQCLALHSQQQTLQQQDVLAAQSAKSLSLQAQFDTALQASVFDDQQAFLAALMDEQTLTQAGTAQAESGKPAPSGANAGHSDSRSAGTASATPT